MNQEQAEQQIRMITNPRELIQDVGRWAESQPWHPRHAPDYGVVEEIGELSHAVLKNLQGIRGFDNIDKFRAAVLDALGDIMVFLSHWCYLRDAHFIARPVVVPASMEMRDCIEAMMTGATRMLSLNRNQNLTPETCTTVATQITVACQYAARMFGWDLLEDCLYPTWHRVRLRNFNKNAVDGGNAEIVAALGEPSVAPKSIEETAVNAEAIEGERPIGG